MKQPIEKKWIRFRIYLVATFFLCAFAVILARAFEFQVLERADLEAKARARIIGTTKLPPRRGMIYDRDGHQLAASVEMASIYAHPRQMKDRPEAAVRLARALEEDPVRISKLLDSQRPFVWLGRKVAPQKSRAVEKLKLEGIGSITEIKRYYAGSELAAHVLGFVGEDNQGLEGLERKFDDELRGPQFTLYHMRDALGRSFAISRPVSSDQEMCHLTLTIDKEIQYKSQQVLRAAVTKSRAKSGQCVVLDPRTGEILAMAVMPEFDPNRFGAFPGDAWRNRAITDCFEPGSTLKTFLLAAALDHKAVSPATTFDCEGGQFRIGRNTIRDTHKYDVLSVSEIVQVSSNIGAIKIGQRLGYATFCRYLEGFGLGAPTGIELLGERSGFFRAAKDARPIEQATLFFGQGLTVTALQLATAMGAIANGGVLMRPHVVKKVVSDSGQVVAETRPLAVGRVVAAETAARVRHILEGVVGPEGTAPQAAIAGFRVGGKTGTSQKVDPKTRRYSRSKYVATFVGFVPVDNPRLVILVCVDEPKGHYYGGLVAAPAFREVGQWALNYLRVNPEVMAAETVNPAQGTAEGPGLAAVERIATELREESAGMEGGLIPDFTGMSMRDVLKEGRLKGLKVVPEGSGMAVRQKPQAGSRLTTDATVHVTFQPPGVAAAKAG